MAERDDDDLGDDDQLRAMRGVWLSMREGDAEPSSRGMAELLAAARAQVAARPQPEPAWKRALAAIADLLRRPPVLALATVVLVAGTAVLVHNHGGMATDEAPVASPPATPTPATASQLDRSAVGAQAGSSAVAEAPSASVQAAAPPPMAPPPRPAAHTASSGSPSPKHAPSPTGAGGLAKESKPMANTLAMDADGPPEEKTAPAPPPPPRPAPMQLVAPSDDNGAPGAASQDKLSDDQLLRESEAAAARGDCAAVRTMVARLRAQDPAFYRSTVARDSALAKCVPAAAQQPPAKTSE